MKKSKSILSIEMIICTVFLALGVIGCKTDLDDKLPGIPPGLRVEQVIEGSTLIRISWDHARNAAGYYLFMSYSLDDPFVVIRTTTTTMIYSQIPANTHVYYRVSAYNIYGVSEESPIYNIFIYYEEPEEEEPEELEED